MPPTASTGADQANRLDDTDRARIGRFVHDCRIACNVGADGYRSPGAITYHIIVFAVSPPCRCHWPNPNAPFGHVDT